MIASAPNDSINAGHSRPQARADVPSSINGDGVRARQNLLHHVIVSGKGERLFLGRATSVSDPHALGHASELTANVRPAGTRADNEHPLPCERLRAAVSRTVHDTTRKRIASWQVWDGLSMEGEARHQALTVCIAAQGKMRIGS